MLLNRYLRKCRRLLLGLSLLPCKRHPFADDCSPRVVLGLHFQLLQAFVPRTFLVSGMSAIERRRNEQPGADQHSEGDSADDRENAVPAIGRLGPGSGLLRC